MMLTGVALVSYGAWVIFEPAGFIVAGMLMTLGGVQLGRKAHVR